MKLSTRSLRMLLLLAVCQVLLGGCQPRSHLTKANVDQVAPGMAKKQVESILGMPSSVDTKDFEVKRKTTYVYAQANGTVTIVFWEDRLESKESTLTK